ncbi:MAG: hypothetical protein JWL69_1080, partial [Phycisphaerales bacterium]|nr:hypothetical protein [Phycisphaerales bacterium]
MNVTLLTCLVLGCGLMMLLEKRGLPTTLALTFKGDVKRETRWLAQYGQFVCSGFAALLVWQLEPSHERRKAAIVIVIAVSMAALIATLLKRLLSRVRPGRENA